MNENDVPVRSHRRKIRSLASALAVAAAFSAGTLVAAYLPEFAAWHDGATAGLRSWIAASMSKGALLGVALGIPAALYLFILLASVAERRRFFLIPAVLLSLVGLSAGLMPLGHERTVLRQLETLTARQKDHDRDTADIRNRLAARETEAKDLSARLTATTTERDVLQLKLEAETGKVAALVAEIEQLKKKPAVK